MYPECSVYHGGVSMNADVDLNVVCTFLCVEGFPISVIPEGRFILNWQHHFKRTRPSIP